MDLGFALRSRKKTSPLASTQALSRLLAQLAARQALTPTAQVQNRLGARDENACNLLTRQVSLFDNRAVARPLESGCAHFSESAATFVIGRQ
jgi:hypothetical protein